MLVKVRVPAQKKQIELLSEVTFTAEVICSTENPGCTEWSINPKGLGHSSTLPRFSSVILVKKEDAFTLKIEFEMNGICSHVILDVESAEEVANFPAIQRRYKR